MLDVANDAVATLLALVGDAVDSDVHNHGAFFDHVGGDEFGFADGYNQDVGLTGQLGDVLGFAVADGHGAVEPFARKEVGDGGADDVAAAEHYAVLARGFDTVAFEQGADAHGGGGDEGLFTQDHAAYVDGCEPVNVLVGRDGVDDVLLVDMLGQGKLDDEAVDFGVGVEKVDGAEQLLLGDGLREAVDGGDESDLVAGFFLVGHVGLAGTVVAYDDRGQMRGAVSLEGELSHFVGDFVFNLQGHGLAVK